MKLRRLRRKYSKYTLRTARTRQWVLASTTLCEDSVMDFYRRGKFSFRNFCEGVTRDLVNAASRDLVGRLLK